MSIETAKTRLTLNQIFSVIPKEAREGKHLCPACQEWHLTIAKNTGDLNCFTPGCSATAAAAAIWKLIDQRKGKPAKNEEPWTALTLAEYANHKGLSQIALR